MRASGDRVACVTAARRHVSVRIVVVRGDLVSDDGGGGSGAAAAQVRDDAEAAGQQQQPPAQPELPPPRHAHARCSSSHDARGGPPHEKL